MTQDEIIKLARQAGLPEAIIEMTPIAFERFAKLVSTKEREACAKVCEAGINNATDWDSSFWDQACENRAQAIRAREQA